MKNKVKVILIVIAFFALAVSYYLCNEYFGISSKIEVNASSDNFASKYIVNVPYKNSVAYIALQDDSIIYMEFKDSDSIFYRHSIVENTTIEIGVIPNFVISAGFAILSGESLYNQITVRGNDPKVNYGFKNVLYKIDLDKNSLSQITSDTEYLPAAYIYPYKNKILSLYAKRSSNHFTAFMTVFDINKKQFTSKSKDYVLDENSYKGNRIVNCCTSGELIYALTIESSVDVNSQSTVNANNHTTIKVLNEAFELINEIELGEDVLALIANSRVGTMRVFGDFIFMRNYSGNGLIGLIENNSIKTLLIDPELDMAVNPNQQELPRFFKRHTNKYYTIDEQNKCINEMELEIKEGYSILSMLSSGEYSYVHLTNYDLERLVLYIPNSSFLTQKQTEKRNLLELISRFLEG